MPNTTVPAAATGLPEDTTNPLTRRTILAGLAGAALVAAAPVAAAATADADAELLRLHGELRPLALTYGKTGDRWREAESEFIDWLAERGITMRTLAQSDPGCVKLFELRRLFGVEELSEEHNRAGAAVDVVTTAMGEIPAATPLGMRCKLDALLIEIGTDPECVFNDPLTMWPRERIDAFADSMAALIGGRVA